MLHPIVALVMFFNGNMLIQADVIGLTDTMETCMSYMPRALAEHKDVIPDGVTAKFMCIDTDKTQVPRPTSKQQSTKVSGE